MNSVALLTRVVAVLAFSTTAFAADMPQGLPPPQPQYQPMPLVVQQPASAWYLRGYIGVGMINSDTVQFIQNPRNSSNFSILHSSIGDTTFFGAGIGYEWNSWLRFDVTAEYRNKAPVNFYGAYTSGGGYFLDTYQGSLQSSIFLANAYIDLGTWNCLTPFIGFGIGGAWNKFADLTDYSTNGGNGIGNNSTNFNFAWALHAGLAYNVTQNFTVELAYRYLNYGSVTDSINCTGGCNPDSYKLQSLTSNDFMIGMRWRFPVESAPILVAQPTYVQPAPVVSQPLPIYQPPPAPVYQPQQYPLQTRG